VLKIRLKCTGVGAGSVRRFDRNLAPPHDIAHALERDQEWHDDQTTRDEACKED
jgi:hypothetical protein